MEYPKVSVVLPLLINEEWQRIMTRCCIDTMRTTTQVSFELVIVECGSNHFEQDADIFIHTEKDGTLVKDLNRGLDAAAGEFVVHTGNDVFTKPGWLEAMLMCFEANSDCGVACLASSDLKHKPANKIMEGLYGPCMMFRRGWFFDPEFENIFSDSDLIMRIYEAGFRSYRNWNVVVTHLYQQTFATKDCDLILQERHNKYLDLFKRKHGNSSLLMFRAFTEGWVL